MFLASGAKKGAPSAEPEPSNLPAAARTGFGLPAIDLMVILIAAAFSLGIQEIPDRRTPGSDRFSQDRFHRPPQSPRFVRR